jgi:magnesium transporter
MSAVQNRKRVIQFQREETDAIFSKSNAPPLGISRIDVNREKRLDFSMTEPERFEPWKELKRRTDEGDSHGLQEYLEDLRDEDVTHAVTHLSEEDQANLLATLPPEEASRLLDHLPDAQSVEIFENLAPTEAANIVLEMPQNEQADMIGDLEEEQIEAILAELPENVANEIRELSRYPDDVAGGLMITEVIICNQSDTVDDVVGELRRNADRYRDYDVQYVYVCDSDDRLVGVLRLRDLLLARRNRSIGELMIPDPLSVNDDATLEELGAFFDRHHLFGVPVVDSSGRLLGVVGESEVAEAWGDRNEEDFLKTQGIVGGEELRSMPLLLRSRRRLSWLSVNIFLNVIAASVIAFYQDTLSSVIALAVFLPIISDMSGCSGNQAVAVSMRELVLGTVRKEEWLRVLLKEISLGMINGAALGILIALVAIAWKGNPYLGLVVGAALCLNTMMAVSLGGTIPLFLKRFGMDPAIASGPILTTVTDMMGFFFVLGLATLMLAQLT